VVDELLEGETEIVEVLEVVAVEVTTNTDVEVVPGATDVAAGWVLVVVDTMVTVEGWALLALQPVVTF
jgi:hypothetical protein